MEETCVFSRIFSTDDSTFSMPIECRFQSYMLLEEALPGALASHCMMVWRCCFSKRGQLRSLIAQSELNLTPVFVNPFTRVFFSRYCMQ